MSIYCVPDTTVRTFIFIDSFDPHNNPVWVGPIYLTPFYS